MAQAQIYTGTWEELNAHSDYLRGRRNLTLIVPEEDTESVALSNKPLYLAATSEEFQKAFDALGHGHENSPVLPTEAFDRETLYDEDRF